MKKTFISSLIVSALPLSVVIAETDNEPAARIDPLVVLGTRPDYADENLAGSQDIISREELSISHVNNTMELFTKIPGVYFARYNQGIINTDIGIRGFAAEGSTPHAKLLIDGIPSNLHNGYSEMDQLFPGNIDTIQVYKGNSDPRYGTFNVAGNYHIATRSDIGRDVEVTLGSYNAREIQGYWGEQTGALQHSYFAGYRESEGYRDNYDIDKYSVGGRWFYDLSDDTSLGFIARMAEYDADAPGYLTQEEARKHPTRSAAYARQDGGDKETQSYSLHFDTALRDDLTWSAKAYYNYYERERWVRFSEAGSLGNRYDEQDHYGFISTLSWDINEQWVLNWGLDIERQDVLEQRFGTIGNMRQRDTSNVSRNFDYDFVSKGTYLQVSHTPNKFIAWNAAIRADRIDGDFKQRNAADEVISNQDSYDYGTIVQPKFNLFLYPTDQVTLFANAGRSFQHPVSRSAYTDGDRSARDVSINDGWELGVKWMPTYSLEFRLSYWEQKAKDEFVLVDGVARNVGETLRQGADFGMSWMATDKLTLWGNFSTVDSEIQSPGADKGNELRSIPSYTASTGVSYLFTPALTGRLHYDAQGASYINEANAGGKFGQYNLVNASLDYETSWGNINFQVNNLFNEYYEYVYDFGNAGDPVDTIHSPGDGVNASVSVAYKF